MISEFIEKHFYPFLLSNICFEVGNKTIKKGKLVLIAVRDFHIFFTLQNEQGENKQFITPLPYGIKKMKSGDVEMDYTLETLSMHNKALLFKLKTTTRKKHTRFFDTKVHCKK